jgi:hypothetical protein
LLRDAQRFLQFADSRLALAQAIEQLDPHRLAEHAETLRHELDHRIRKPVRDRVGGDDETKNITNTRLCSWEMATRALSSFTVLQLCS